MKYLYIINHEFVGAFHLILLLIEWQDRTMFMSTCVTGKHPLMPL